MIRIPILRPDSPITPAYMSALRQAIQSDGCSKSPEIYALCCHQHDLAYRFGIDPWGNPMKKSDADALLRRCMQSSSKLGRFSPISWIYWSGVRFFGHRAYVHDIDHREAFETFFFNDLPQIP